ncbi:MAG: helix-turn-helix domain-containing protein [Candidatus Omnitrophota bacterium]|nr:MAG: helix-turn-helix domain-containing protein [Candidatus Omnitrophota bacterium]
MPEKLLTAEEASGLLGIPEEEIKKMVDKGELPAYQIGGCFLRFRREQLEAIRSAITIRLPERTLPRLRQSAIDKLLDFFYFNDFYIISAILAFLILWIIIKT